MKKILVLNYEFPPLGGGAANATFYLLKEFAKDSSLEIDLVTSSVDGFRVEKFSENITIHFLDIGKKGNLHYQSNKNLLVYAWKSYWHSKKLMQTTHFDLCHAFFGIPCGYVAMKLGLPYIVSLRGSDVPFYNNRFYWLDTLIFKRLSRKIWKNARNVVALSKDLTSLAHITNSSQQIKIIYNGIDTQEFTPSARASRVEMVDILFVGRLIERKGLIYLLEAVNNLIKNGRQVRLTVAGDGPLLEAYKIYVDENSLLDRVKFLGVVKHQDLVQIYQNADIFVLPSLNEALGNVTQEALASGLPIITTDTGAAELMSDNGFIIEKASAKEIQASIETLLDNPQLRNDMAYKSRVIALEMAWSKCAESYKNIYESTI